MWFDLKARIDFSYYTLEVITKNNKGIKSLYAAFTLPISPTVYFKPL